MTEFLHWATSGMGRLRDAPEHDRADREQHEGPTRPKSLSISGSALRRWAMFLPHESGREMRPQRLGHERPERSRRRAQRRRVSR